MDAPVKLCGIDHQTPESRTQNEAMRMAWRDRQRDVCRLGGCWLQFDEVAQGVGSFFAPYFGPVKCAANGNTENCSAVDWQTQSR